MELILIWFIFKLNLNQFDKHSTGPDINRNIKTIKFVQELKTNIVINVITEIQLTDRNI